VEKNHVLIRGDLPGYPIMPFIPESLRSDAASIFYQIKKTDQDKIHTLKNKKRNISTKKLN
jgi:hypothetical protein